MMKLVRYEPFDMLAEIPRMMRRSYAWKSDEANENSRQVADATVTPPVSIGEEDDKFLVIIDMPGVAPDQVSVTFDKEVCTVKGCRPDLQQEFPAESSYTHDERMHGNFQRSFRCETVDPERITAKIEHGLLKITMMKYAEVQPRNIVVEC